MLQILTTLILLKLPAFILTCYQPVASFLLLCNLVLVRQLQYFFAIKDSLASSHL